MSMRMVAAVGLTPLGARGLWVSSPRLSPLCFVLHWLALDFAEAADLAASFLVLYTNG